MKRKSIAVRFVVVLILIPALLQGALWLWFVKGQRAYYAESLRDRIRTVTGLLGNFATTAIMSYDYTYLDQYVEALVRDDDIVSVRIIDKQGNILRERIFRNETRGGSLNPFYIPWKNTLSSPIKSGEETVGSIEVAYTGQKANSGMLNLLVVSFGGQMLVLLFLSFAIYFVFRKTVGRPVEIINDTLARVTAGDLTAEVPKLGNDEIGSIAAGVGFLVEKLSRTIQRTHSISGNVAMAIEQLTIALWNASENAKRQAKSIHEVVAVMRQANESQMRVAEHTDRLSSVSSENVSSLLEMKATAEEITSSTGKLFKSTEDSYAMVAEMSQTAKVIAGNANEVFRSVESASSSVEEISASLNEVLENARKSAEFSAYVRVLLTEKGTLAVADSVEAMEKITEEVGRVSAVITRLDERSKEIEKVLAVIREVTESTNLLSLNAAILAAQAGEYGKSFAVVADEIRALSDRTSSSARDIASIVRTIQGEVTEAVRSIRTGARKVDAGKELIFKAGEAMGETLDAARRSAQMAEIIEKATNEQATGLRQITSSMEKVRHMVEEMVKATEEQKRGSTHMLEDISDVKEVAEVVKRGAEEHAEGIKLISRNLELSLDMVGEINRSAVEQQQTNEGVVAAVDEMKNAGTAAMKDTEELTLSFNTLKEEIESLKKEIGTFRVG